MRVILLQDVKNIGKKHQVVEVKDGYAKNFLIKNKLAVSSTITANEILKNNLIEEAKLEGEKIAHANVLKKQIENVKLTFSLKTFDNNVFGNISYKQIIDTLNEKHHIKIDKYMINSHNEKNITLGRYIIKINLYKHIIADLAVEVKGVANGE